MKNINIKQALLMLSILIFLNSCQDIVTYNDGYDDGMTSTGKPIINAIYQSDDIDRLLPITEAAFEDIIVLQGENLSNIKKVTLNNINIELNEIYATAKYAFIQIPRKMPEEINNKLFYETKLGNTDYEFIVNIPKLQIEGLYNEFTLPGDTVQLKGKYFDLYGFGNNVSSSTITMDGIDLEIDSISEQYMSVIIPIIAKDNSIIEISYLDDGEPQTKKIPYRMTESVIWDLSKPDNYGFWAGKQYITDGEGELEPNSLCGPYFRIAGSYGSWSWNNLLCGGFNCPLDIASNPSDYNFKFEVCSSPGNPFYDSGDFGYLIQLNGSSYSWNPSKNGSFNTYGKWYTVTIDLGLVSQNIFNEGWTGLSFILQPNSDWSIDHSFANIRIEKK